MNKLIQTISLTMVVFSPLTLITLPPSAIAHHTASHLSTVAIETSIPKKQRRVKRLRKSTAPKATRMMKPKATAPATMQPGTGMSSSESTPPAKTTTPVRPAATPAQLSPSSKVKKIDPMLTNPSLKKGGVTQLPPANGGVPNIPLDLPGSVPNPAGNTPSIPRPNIPNVPGG